MTRDTEQILADIDDATRLQVEQWPDRGSGFEGVMRLTRELAAAFLAEKGPEACSEPRPGDATKLISRGVFLGGSPKGGTTMLVQLFDGHPDLLVMPGDSRMIHLLDAGEDETGIEPLLGYWLRQSIAPNNLPPFWCLGRGAMPYRALARAYQVWRTELGDRPAGCYLAAVLALAEARGMTSPSAFVEKTCANVLHPERVYATLPDAKIVHIVRDPYATLPALHRQTTVRGWDWPFEGRLDHVAEYLRAALRNPTNYGADRYRLVRYEDIVADAGPVMRGLAEFIGVPFDDVLTRPTVLGQDAESNSMFDERRARGALVAESRDATLRRWDEAFSPDQQDTIVHRIGDIADQLGYSAPSRATA